MSPGIGAAVVGCILMTTIAPACAQTGTSCDRSPPLVKFVTPRGDPTSHTPSREAASEFVYRREDRTAPSNALDFTFSVVVTVTPDTTLLDPVRIEAIRFRVPEIDHSPHRWSPEVANLGAPEFDGTHLTATVTYSGLPRDNSAFGPKTIEVLLPAENDPSVLECIGAQPIEVFYDGRDGNPFEKEQPNWFYFYKQNAIAQQLVGDAFRYGCDSGRSSASHGQGERCIEICNDAYDARNTYYLADARARPLEVTGESEEIHYYTSFVATLMHELDHANNNVTISKRRDRGSDGDDDNDGLLDEWEREVTHTAPDDSHSVIDRGKYPRGSIINPSPSGPEPDNEMYAASIVERCAAQRANTGQDWAQPGTNYREGFILQDQLRSSDAEASARQCVPVSPPRPPDQRPCAP